MRRITSICICIVLFFYSCVHSPSLKTDSTNVVSTRATAPVIDLNQYDVLAINANEIFTLKNDWDLKGGTYILPEGVTLVSKGGVFKNGTLIGSNTKIGSDVALFDKVTIQGAWNVSNVSTHLFTDLSYENALRDVFALAHPEVENKVLIEYGEYILSASAFQPALSVCSNMDLVIDGTIRLLPNEHKGSYVLSVDGAKNVTISGRGCIIGDKHNHQGEEGEWGHGIYVRSSEKVTIQDFIVKDCWGDCIYVGKLSKDVTIRKCKLDHGRRQGISVTSAVGVLIEDCEINNVSGTDPQSAIDIEPNHNEIVDNIVIRNVRCYNCEGGIETWRPKDARIGSVLIEGCLVLNSTKRWPIVVRYAETAKIENCAVEADSRTAIMAAQVGDIKILNNKVSSTSKHPIIVSKCKKSDVKGNVIQNRKKLK